MALAQVEKRSLARLATRKDLPVALENDMQVDFWRRLESRGYVKILPRVRIMFDLVYGDYLDITEAGRLAIAE